MIRTLSAIFTLLSICAPACAHDLWVQPSGSELQIICGHEKETLPCAAATIKEVSAIGADGIRSSLATRVQGKGRVATLQSGMVAVTALQDEGFLCVTPDGEKPLPKSSLKDAVEASYNKHFTKSLLGWHKTMARPVGAELEVVPLKNPLLLKSGAKLPVVVYYKGKPRAEVWVDDGTNDGIREKTDSKGRLTVTVGKKGRQFVTAFLDLPYKNPAEADKLALSANLTWLVK